MKLAVILVVLWDFLVSLGTFAFPDEMAGRAGTAGDPVEEPAVPVGEWIVTTTADGGEGSLRRAILDAVASPGPDIIRFDGDQGPFGSPREIRLEAELPVLVGELTIDGYIPGRLWEASGVTVHARDRFPVFRVAPGARVTLASFTVAGGRGRNGGGIQNGGDLVVRSMTLLENRASRRGGGLANLGGTVQVINSTFAGNRAGRAGGGLANLRGGATVTNCTFSANSAGKGGGLFSRGDLVLRNSIVAAGGGAEEACRVAGNGVFAGTHNLIRAHRGCGEPISTADPMLGELGNYQGPTFTIPLRGGSPAINLGDNASALDETGRPLQWDQRGNGDPRYVAGFTDIGAFEVQAFPWLVVDTLEDSVLRACTRSGPADCPLRGAIELANATPDPDVIRFDPAVFDRPRSLLLNSPLPELSTDMTLDGSGSGGIILVGSGEFPLLRIATGARVQLIEVRAGEEPPAP